MNKNVLKDVDSAKSFIRSVGKKTPATAIEKTVSVLKLVHVTNEQAIAAKDAQSRAVKKGLWSLTSSLIGKVKMPTIGMTLMAASPKKTPPTAANLTLPHADVPPSQANLTLPHKNSTLPPLKAVNLTLPAIPPPTPPAAQIIEPTSSAKSESVGSDRETKSKMNKRTSDVQSQFAKLFKDISSRKLAPGTSIGHPTAFPIIKNKGAKVQQSSPDIIHKKTAMLQVPPSNFFPLIKKKSLTTKKTNAADDAVSASLNKSRMTKNQTELVGQAKNATAKSAIKSVGVEESKQPAQGSKKRKMRLRKSLSIYRFLLIITGVVIVLLASSLIFVLVFLLGMERPYALAIGTNNATTERNLTEPETSTAASIWTENNSTEITTSLLDRFHEVTIIE